MERWWPRAVDALLCLVVLLTGLAEVWVPFESRTGSGDVTLTSVQVVIMAGALWWRRTRPLWSTAVVCAAMAGFHLAGVSYLLFNGQFLPLVLVTFAVARHGQGRVPYLGGGMVAVTMVVGDLTIEELGSVSELIFHWSVLTVAYALGTWQRVMAHRAEEARRRAVEAEVEAARQAMAAVTEERTRIARELHDVVGHAMSLMVVQAGAGELAADRPEEVRATLDSIRRTGSDALAEMRRLVTMLRDPDESASLAPQPGLTALEGLVDEARSHGLPVKLAITGDVRQLPAGLDLAAYRIVQEALTNARHHALGATEIPVTVHFFEDEIRVEVADDGSGDGSTAGSGHGLIGMRERVSLYGGTLETGPTPGGGFMVAASLPVEAR